MALETMHEKLSIKNLLFSKAIPNHVIPIPVAGYKVFPCIDCGDRFLFESSYDFHVNRQSVKISYMCRHCSQMLTFYNRCKLLSHIRSHAFRTATINVYDLQIEPIPMSCLKFSKNISTNKTTKRPKVNASFICIECNKDIGSESGEPLYKIRQNHYMQYTNELHSCPICLFTMPTICGLRTHIRLHLKCPLYYCPECGAHLAQSMNYPYNHYCEGFQMMRATARFKCAITNCPMFHPNEYKDHIKQKHLKKVFKCPFCVVACFNEQTMERHLKGHKTDARASIFYQCELCPGKLVLQNHLDIHLKSHLNNTVPVFPCWSCGEILKDAAALLTHHVQRHVLTDDMKNVYTSMLNIAEANANRGRRSYRVIKTCDQCKRCFTYKCKYYRQIKDAPNDCPYKCTKEMQVSLVADGSEIDSNTLQSLKCNLCKRYISQDWSDIKKHFGTHHKTHKCLDAKLVVKKLDYVEHLRQKKQKATRVMKKYSKRVIKPQNNLVIPVDPTSIVMTTLGDEINQYKCKKCGHGSVTKELLEIHMLVHRDPCMAYQCMECGESFVVKPTFIKHLLLEHSIEDTDQYIATKKCYNENALTKTQFNDVLDNLPLKENQCRICRDQFQNVEDLEKHFRVHGMAFLLKNTCKTNTSP